MTEKEEKRMIGSGLELTSESGVIADEEPKPRVLIVDDDELVLASLQSLFRFESGYELDAETNPTKAARLLSIKRFDVVISDLLMPGMDGIELLETAAKLQPDATRVLLTGYGNGRRIRNAVQELDLHYIDKPWDNATILSIARNALRRKSRSQ